MAIYSVQLAQRRTAVPLVQSEDLERAYAEALLVLDALETDDADSGIALDIVTETGAVVMKVRPTH